MPHPLQLMHAVTYRVLSVPGKHSRGMLLALAIWLTIFMTRPHKEERFLFPVYPLLCFAVVYGMERVEVSQCADEGMCHVSLSSEGPFVHRVFLATLVGGVNGRSRACLYPLS